MNNKRSLVFASIVAALAGFLFGFDTAVISGADKPIQQLWQTSALFHGTFIMSMALWGTVIGALFGGIPCDRYGRKNTLIAIGVLYFISAVGSALAPEPFSFSFFRFIGGLGVGASSVAAPTYISEIAPASRRGRLVILYQFMIVLGILVAFISNWLVGSELGDNAWRWMIGIEAFPAFIYLILVFRIPNSPRWLVLHRNDQETALELIKALDPNQDAEEELRLINTTEKIDSGNGFFSGKYNFPIILAFLVAFFNQLSGINFVIYYAPRIFESAGLASSTALLSSVGIGVVNLVFTMLGIVLIDRAGRKTLMLIGSVGYIVTLAVVSWAFYTGAGGTIVVIFLFGFIASHAVGQGAIIWVFISEIFPNHVRAAGQAFGTGVHWVFAALITLFTLFFMDILGDNPAPLFAFFSFMMVLQLLFTIKMMPETKGRSLEELALELTGSKEEAKKMLDSEV
ncbi:MAG TPA: MFS transporter [Balneolaceae bacterium]|nr:MFS transporter [Balneolaceae bacterium]|tara:strand:+ start:70520 stop:71890 length:1371 start_codon:yes stop_codon:yes gene_type:complete